MMWFKVHKKGKSVLASVCSDDLLGKKLESKDQDLDINEHFFVGEKLELKDLKSVLTSYDNITLVGNDIVDEAIRLGHIKEDNVQTIQGVKWIICLSE